MHGYRTFPATLMLLALCGAGSLSAQRAARSDSAAAMPAPSAMATRSELEAALAGQKGNTPLAASIRRRLQEGDIQTGDRIYLEVQGEEALTDTFVVRTGRVLVLPNIPEQIPMQGLLRSELDGYLTRAIAKYIRDPQVDATAMIRVAVLGAVNKPGFYNLPPETLASDVMMLAGGPANDADIRKTVVRRSGTEVAAREQVQAALDRGASLDQMSVNSGDEIVVGKNSGGAMRFLPYIGALTGIIFAVTRI